MVDDPLHPPPPYTSASTLLTIPEHSGTLSEKTPERAGRRSTSPARRVATFSSVCRHRPWFNELLRIESEPPVQSTLLPEDVSKTVITHDLSAMSSASFWEIYT
ncbi:hypothetical protein JOB18_004499 [Solea senegalensis]|uniref:Uncharacterized protein n=1 Tax=Solea senegalensis TaxID=28829 RepID=A0AAV6PFJ6_SOLSE|nr:hypothetical protein JOB18_004499 [Solea senegalensis]